MIDRPAPAVNIARTRFSDYGSLIYLGRPDDALRYTYLAGAVDSIAVAYHHLGQDLRRYADEPALALASYRVSALIRALAGLRHAAYPIMDAAIDVRVFSAAEPPADIEDLRRPPGPHHPAPGTGPRHAWYGRRLIQAAI